MVNVKSYALALIGLTPLLWGTAKVNAQSWEPVCARMPASLDATTAPTLGTQDCFKTAVQAQLQGQEGYLHTYQFRHGPTIRVFMELSAMASPPDRPYRIYYAIGDGPWLPGWRQEIDFLHECYPWSCYWLTVKEDEGQVIVAEAGSI